MTDVTRLSFRGPLAAALATFLEGEGMACDATADGLTLLVPSLGHYHEEGVAMFPHVLICDSIDASLSVIQGQDVVVVGEDDRLAAVMADALKRCAPLAQGGWAIFVERPEGRFRYGVFRQSAQPLALSVAEGLLESGGEVPMLLIVQLAESVVELRGASGRTLEINLAAPRIEGAPSPREPLISLATSATSAIPAGDGPDVARYLVNAFARILQRSHGTLIAVIREHPSATSILGSYVRFHPPVDIGRRVIDYKVTRGLDELAALNGAATFLAGALSCDGVTLLTSAAQVIGYRGFLSFPAANSTSGGGRRRAFEALCSDESGLMVAVFYQSQDGQRECRRRDP